MDTDSEFMENIKACRTCGIHYVTPTSHQLKHLFQSPLEHSEIMLIRLELAQWNVEVSENDGYPQFICNTCVHKFEQVFELRASCISAQNEFRKFYNVANANIANIKIKTELHEADEELPICDFIYVDDLSDTEYDGATPFNIPHVPIKVEQIEAATIPMEVTQQPTHLVESASRVVVQTAPSSPHTPQRMPPLNESVAAASPPAAISVQMPVDQVECKLCQHLSPSPDEHKQHMQRAHEIRDMDCHICGKEFKNSTPARLKFHMKWHTLNKHVKCAECGFVCKSKDALKEHKRANHGRINCKICGKGVLAKKMKSHLRQHELLTKYACEYCTEVFATEDERENHIWQIHANEDNNTAANTIPTSQTAITQEAPQEAMFEVQQAQEILSHESQDDIVNYKFLCAHCEQGFMEQIDLEVHVKEQHRPNTYLAAVQTETADFDEQTVVNKTNETTNHDQEDDDDDEHTNITVFQDYDNDTEEVHVPANDNDSFINNNTPVVTQESEHMENEENDQHEYADETPEYHTETASNTSATDEEDSNATDSNDETFSMFSAYDQNKLNTFACAKCSETFATIEQLRQHYEQHLAAAQTKTTPTKSKFKCNLCGKSFDLKFSLNRHVKKHKTAPI